MKNRSKVLIPLAIAAFSMAAIYATGLVTYWQKQVVLVDGTPDANELVNQEALKVLLKNANSSHSDAIVILCDGQLVGSWNSTEQPIPIEAMSTTKSIVSLAIGRAKTLGHIESIDTPVHRFFPEWDNETHRTITLQHLLRHSSGLECLPNTADIYAQDNFVQYALQAEPVTPPGTSFEYNNRQTNLLSAIIEQSTGQKLDDFLGAELFSKLGITQFSWTRDESGNPHGMSGLAILPRDLAKLGQLMLDGGRYKGKQLIEERWVDESLEPNPELLARHGLMWWLSTKEDHLDYYYAEGFLGQYLVIIPDSRIVGVRMYRAGLLHSFTYNDGSDGYDSFAEDLRRLTP